MAAAAAEAKEKANVAAELDPALAELLESLNLLLVAGPVLIKQEITTLADVIGEDSCDVGDLTSIGLSEEVVQKIKSGKPKDPEQAVDVGDGGSEESIDDCA